MTPPTSTDRLVGALCGDLEPVARHPGLLASAVGVTAVWVGELIILSVFSGLRGDLSHVASTSVSFTLALGALLVAALGAIWAGLATAIPGRETARTWGSAAAGLALVVGLVSCALALAGVESGASLSRGEPLASDWACFWHSILMAMLPAGATAWVMIRGWVGRPLVAAALGLAGSAAAGALIAQLACGAWGPRHLLLGHLAVPLAAALLGAAPIAYALRRLRG